MCCPYTRIEEDLVLWRQRGRDDESLGRGGEFVEISGAACLSVV